MRQTVVPRSNPPNAAFVPEDANDESSSRTLVRHAPPVLFPRHLVRLPRAWHALSLGDGSQQAGSGDGRSTAQDGVLRGVGTGAR